MNFLQCVRVYHFVHDEGAGWCALHPSVLLYEITVLLYINSILVLYCCVPSVKGLLIVMILI